MVAPVPAGFVTCEPLAFGTGATVPAAPPVIGITEGVLPVPAGFVACEPLAFGTGATVPVVTGAFGIIAPPVLCLFR